MLKKEITYTDYDDKSRTETFYFDISESEYTEMDLSIPGGFEAMIKTIVDKQDIPKMIQVFKDLLKRSYGVKSPDGRRMSKSPELFDEFKETRAYNTLFMDLLSDSNNAVEFIKGIMPIDKSRMNEVDAALENAGLPARR